MAKAPKVQIDNGGGLRGIVTYRGQRYMAGASGTVDGVRSVLLVGGTSFWVPESEVTL